MVRGTKSSFLSNDDLEQDVNLYEDNGETQKEISRTL